MAMSSVRKISQWTFLTNHAHVLVCIAREHAVRMREIASAVGITERAVQKIVLELERDGYLTRIREGRRNRYEIEGRRPLRHAIEGHRTIADLLALVRDPPKPRAGTARRSRG